MNPAIAIDLSNTPGIYYAFAYWLGGLLYIQVNKKRASTLWQTAMKLLFLFLLCGFMLIMDRVPVYLFIPCVLIVILLLFTFIRSCCDISTKKAAYFSMRAFILGEFAASLEWQLFYYGLTTWNLPLRMDVNLTFLCIVHTTVFGSMYLLERRHRESNDKLHISRKELWAIGFLCATIYATSNLSYAFDATPFSSRFPLEIFIIRTIVDFAGVGMMYAYHVQLKELNVRMEKEFLQNMLHMQYVNYQISEESIALINQKYHDLKHQIELLRAEVSTEKKLSYLQQVEEDIRAYETQNKTGNRVLDILLATKGLQCQKEGITLTCVADGEELSFIDPVDLSALFGNALDNAIESVRKIMDPEKRLIHLSVGKQRNFLLIRIENCYEGTIEFQNGVPATTKRNRRFHGFGITSIHKTVEKYHGSVTIDTRNGWFELRLLFPVESGNAKQ